MHLALHPAFQDLDEESFAEHSEHVEHALHAHQRGNHLFCLRPAETQRILSELRLGPVASRTLSIIERRFQDYLGSYRRSARVVRLAPLRLSDTIIPGPSETLLAAEDLIEFLEFAPAFYVENGYNDGIFYKHIISIYLRREIGSSDFVNIRPFHGGGNSLGDALRQAVGRHAVGMCICDRDTCRLVPPLSSHSSAARAFAALCDLGVCTGAGIPNDQLPSFYFDVTAGWSVENFIWPNLLDLFFDVSPQYASYRSEFCGVFPTFPVLSLDEQRIWWLVNFRSSAQDAAALRLCALERFVVRIDQDRAENLANLKMPPDVVSGLNGLLREGRYSRASRDAVARDLHSQEYSVAVGKIAVAAQTSLAGDSLVGFA